MPAKQPSPSTPTLPSNQPQPLHPHPLLCWHPALQVHLDRVERFIVTVGQCEDAIFQRRMRMLQRQKVRIAPACLPACVTAALA